MSFQEIKGYFDVSGKEENQKDKVIVVAGYLAEAEQWRDFSADWLKVLKEEKVPVEKNNTLPEFHATDFHARQGVFKDRNIWTDEKCGILYNKLIDIINTHTLYPVGMAILLNDYRKLRTENPALVLAFQKVGSLAANLAFWHCAQWAEKHNYNDSISYIFDMGDSFRTEITKAHEMACKSKQMREKFRLKKGEIDFKDTEEYNPIQAADIIAWEIAKDIKESEITGIENHTTRPEFRKLALPKADFKFYNYDDLNWFWTSKFAPFILEDIYRRNEKEKWFDSDDFLGIEEELEIQSEYEEEK